MKLDDLDRDAGGFRFGMHAELVHRSGVCRDGREMRLRGFEAIGAFGAAGFTEVIRPTDRRVVMRLDL